MLGAAALCLILAGLDGEPLQTRPELERQVELVAVAVAIAVAVALT